MEVIFMATYTPLLKWICILLGSRPLDSKFHLGRDFVCFAHYCIFSESWTVLNFDYVIYVLLSFSFLLFHFIII